MFDDIYEFKVGDIVTLTLKDYGHFEYNIWKVTKHLIGGYIVENLITKDEIWPNYFDVSEWKPDAKNVPYHEGHEIVESFIWNPKHDAYWFCRTCKDELNLDSLFQKKAEEWASKDLELDYALHYTDDDDFGLALLDYDD